MTDVFISYSSEDRDRVRPLAAALEARGLTVWWDRALASGDDYASVIQKALDGAKVVIVIWSRNSVNSPWVRDEAGRARDARRLAPILFDKVDIPMGFGSINAEDFTAWNGQPHAAQVDLIYEAIKARLEGRAPDSAALQAKRRRLVGRIRLVSVLTALALTVGIVAGVLNIMDRNKPVQVVAASAAPAQTDAGRLLDLVNSGKITGDQAVALSKLLQQQAFADIPEAAEDAAASSASPPASTTSAAAPASAGTTIAAPAPSIAMAANAGSAAPGSAAPAAVSTAELNQTARATFADAAAQLLQDPDPKVRAAAVEASRPASRKVGMDKLWALAQANGPSSAAIYRYCAAIGAVTDDPRTQVALERARDANPQDRRLWRMLSYRYARKDDPDGAAGAALVGEGLAAAAKGASDQANVKLERALPLLKQPGSRAFVLGQLGDAAAKRDDWAGAEKRYRAAVDIHTQNNDVGGVAIDAPKLARAQLQQGDKVRACGTLQRARKFGVQTVTGQISQACEVNKTP